ncbi:unnamed protein product [Prorocentrum cordatum]|uniref:Uncharacterized protein n=1 Tax=Prorocentrum cordatum TaxID=2364126 RepID=A0ABN9P9P1_9DINO|nr:unnamed protein product [Polarella glacialis]
MIRRELCIHLCISTKRVKERKYGGRKLKRRLESLHACALQARALGTSAAANFFPMPNQHNEANVKSPGIPRHICSGANERAKKLTVPQCAEPPGGEADGRRSKQEGGAREKGGQKDQGKAEEGKGGGDNHEERLK